MAQDNSPCVKVISKCMLWVRGLMLLWVMRHLSIINSLLIRLSDFTFTFLHWRRKWQPTPVFLPGESQGLGAWWGAVHGVAQSRTQLSYFTFTFHFHAMEKEMATLENPRYGGAWWAAIYWVAQSQTWLKRLSSSSSINIWSIYTHLEIC